MSIQKFEVKEKIISAKITANQKEKLEKLALKHGLSLSNLIGQLISTGYMNETNTKSF